jgi:hypothetical protein
MEDNNNQYVEVFPRKIVLQKHFDQDNFEGRVNLKNLTNKFIIFKIYINQSNIYSVHPSTSYLPPSSNADITVKRQLKVNLF